MKRTYFLGRVIIVPVVPIGPRVRGDLMNVVLTDLEAVQQTPTREMGCAS